MIETIVSLETAKLLKEKGFNEPCLYYFGCDDKGNLIPKCVAGIQDCECRTVEDLYIQNNLLLEEELLQPTLSLAQKWIREKGIHIGVYANASGWGWILTKCGGNGSCIKEIEDDTFFNTYEDALEEGLKQVLKLI